VEHRREYRFKPNQIATVTVLGLRPGPALQACILDLSGSGMRLRSSLPVPCGSDVEISVNEIVARGNVCRCDPDEDSFEIGVSGLETASKV
jgi:hypothetical protein